MDGQDLPDQLDGQLDLLDLLGGLDLLDLLDGLGLPEDDDIKNSQCVSIQTRHL